MSTPKPTPLALDTTTLARLEAQPPRWAAGLAVDHPQRWTHVTERVDAVDGMSADRLESAVIAAYGRLAAALAQAGRHPVRFWNFIPGIHAEMGGGLDRYMVFNAGRFAAFCEWFGPADTFNRRVPTASAVGVDASASDGALVIHALASTEAGAPMENPRQIPAYSYSQRYGPLPPCFARATRIDDGEGSVRLFVGGTASIVGEDSQHEGDVRRQTLETFDNLARLVTHVHGLTSLEPLADPLARFTALRVYVVRKPDATVVRELVAARLASTCVVEYACADLCRRELLVEIEGVADLRALSAAS